MALGSLGEHEIAAPSLHGSDGCQRQPFSFLGAGDGRECAAEWRKHGTTWCMNTGQKFEALHSTNVEPFERPSEFYHFVGGNHRILTHAQTVAIQGHTYPYFVVNAFIHCNFGRCKNACQGHRTPAAKHSILRPEPSGSSSSSSSSSMSSSCGNNPD